MTSGNVEANKRESFLSRSLLSLPVKYKKMVIIDFDDLSSAAGDKTPWKEKKRNNRIKVSTKGNVQ